MDHHLNLTRQRTLPSSPSRLLTLPAEIRSTIWSYSFDRKCVHVLDIGHVWSEPDTFYPLHTLKDSHTHLAQPYSRCAECPRHEPICLAAVCWQVFNEVAQLRYERTLLSFASSELAISYLNTKISTKSFTGFSLSRLRYLQLYLGPAKYNTYHANTHNHSLLKALAKDATGLKILNLSFAYFYRAPQQILPLGRKTLACLLRFRGLMRLDLQINQAPPGPIGTSELDDGALDQFWFRWRCTVAALQSQVCRASIWTDGWASGSSSEIDILLLRSWTGTQLNVDTLRKLVMNLEADRLDRRTSQHGAVKI